MSTELKTKTVFIVWTNTDLTEGRGYQVPLHICENKATAKRLARKAGVQGCDADVRPFESPMVSGHWLAPFRITPPTKEDIRDQELDNKRESAIARAKELGVSDDDLRTMGVKP